MMPPKDSDSAQLRQFLRHYRPVPPPAMGHLEAEIMGQVLKQTATGQRKRAWIWGLVSLLVFGSGSLVTTQLSQPQALTTSELSELDLYVADRWDSVFNTVEEPLAPPLFSSSLD